MDRRAKSSKKSDADRIGAVENGRKNWLESLPADQNFDQLFFEFMQDDRADEIEKVLASVKLDLKKRAMRAMKAGCQTEFRDHVKKIEEWDDHLADLREIWAAKLNQGGRQIEIIAPRKEDECLALELAQDLLPKNIQINMTVAQKELIIRKGRDYLRKNRLISINDKQCGQIDKKLWKNSVELMINIIKEVTSGAVGKIDQVQIEGLNELLDKALKERNKTINRIVVFYEQCSQELRNASFKADFWGCFAISDRDLQVLFGVEKGRMASSPYQLEKNLKLKNNLRRERNILKKIDFRREILSELFTEVRQRAMHNLSITGTAGELSDRLMKLQTDEERAILVRTVLFNFMQTEKPDQSIVDWLTLTKKKSVNHVEDWLLSIWKERMYKMSLTDWQATVDFLQDLFNQTEKILIKNRQSILDIKKPEKLIDSSYRNWLFKVVLGKYLIVDQPDYLQQDYYNYLIEQGYLIKEENRVYPTKIFLWQLQRLEKDTKMGTPNGSLTLRDNLTKYWGKTEGRWWGLKLAQTADDKTNDDSRYDQAKLLWQTYEEDLVKNEILYVDLTENIEKINDQLKKFRQSGRIDINSEKLANYINTNLAKDEAVLEREQLINRRVVMRKNITDLQEMRKKVTGRVEREYIIKQISRYLENNLNTMNLLEIKMRENDKELSTHKINLGNYEQELTEREQKYNRKKKIFELLKSELKGMNGWELDKLWKRECLNSPYYPEIDRRRPDGVKKRWRELKIWDIRQLRRIELKNLGEEIKMYQKWCRQTTTWLNNYQKEHDICQRRIEKMQTENAKIQFWLDQLNQSERFERGRQELLWSEAVKIIYSDREMICNRIYLDTFDQIGSREEFELYKEFTEHDFFRLMNSFANWQLKRRPEVKSNLLMRFGSRSELVKFMEKCQVSYKDKHKISDWRKDKKRLLTGLSMKAAPEFYGEMTVGEYFDIYRRAMTLLNSYYEITQIDRRIEELDEIIYQKCMVCHVNYLISKNKRLIEKKKNLISSNQLRQKLMTGLDGLGLVFTM